MIYHPFFPSISHLAPRCLCLFPFYITSPPFEHLLLLASLLTMATMLLYLSSHFYYSLVHLFANLAHTRVLSDLPCHAPFTANMPPVQYGPTVIYHLTWSSLVQYTPLTPLSHACPGHIPTIDRSDSKTYLPFYRFTRFVRSTTNDVTPRVPIDHTPSCHSFLSVTHALLFLFST